MEKYCTDCGKVFDDLKYKLCPYCGGKLDTRYGRQPIPRELRHKVFQRDGYRCRECGASKEETSLEIDHIVPVARGGKNDIDNLQTLCRECNRMKHTDEWVGGENTVEVAENELNNLKNQINDLEEKLKHTSNKNDILDYKFKIKKLNKLIPKAQKKLDDSRYEAEIKEKQLRDNQIREVLFKELYVEFDDEILKKVFNHFNLNESSDEENLRLLVDKYSREEIFKTINLFQIFKELDVEFYDEILKKVFNYVEFDDEILKKVFNYFNLNESSDEENLRLLVDKYSREEIIKTINLFQIEELNVTTDNIYDLGNYNLLIILKDGTNLTDWDEVANKEDIIYIIEDISNFTDLSSRYENLKSLIYITTLSTTDKVTNMQSMFAGCESLVDISCLVDWDVSNVTDMSDMFRSCTSLVDVGGLSGWDVSNVTDMSDMFASCTSLVDVGGLSGWDVSNVTDMGNMFGKYKETEGDVGCSSLVDVSGLSGWDVSNVTNMAAMFAGCRSLNDVGGLSGWDVSNVTDMGNMFLYSESLGDISCLVDWDVSNVTSMWDMFAGCRSLNDVGGLSGWDVSNVTNMAAMFIGCRSLNDVGGLSGWDVSNVTDMGLMFGDCTSLVDVGGLSGWDVSNVTSVMQMFDRCESLVDVSVLSGWGEPFRRIIFHHEIDKKLYSP